MEAVRAMNTSQDFNDFLEHITWDTNVIDGLLVGSIAELPLEYVLTKLEDFTVDQLQFSRNECAFWQGDTPPANFTGKVFVVEPVCARPGYARLINSDRGVGSRGKARYLSYDEMTNGLNRNASNGSRGETLIDFIGVRDTFKQQVMSRQGSLGLDGLTLNIKRSITCLSWPPEAAEWGNRKRVYDWPAQDLLQNVMKGGCHLVPFPSPSVSSDNTVFKVSFARAEVALIYAWTPIQKYIYHVLRLIKNDFVKQLVLQGQRDVLSTYHFKTMMLWACETKPPAFWDESCIKSSVDELLCQMIEFLVDRNCPNYFIPSVNLMDHLPDSLDINALIVPLLVFKEQGAARLIAAVPVADPSSKSTIQISKKLINIAQFSLNSVAKHAGHRRSTAKFGEESLKRNLTDPMEFISLHNGVAAHLRLVTKPHRNRDSNTVRSNSNPVRSNPSDYEMAVVNLEHAMLADTRETVSRKASFGDALPEVFTSILFADEGNSRVSSIRLDNTSSESGDTPRKQGDIVCHDKAPTFHSDQSRRQASCLNIETSKDRAVSTDSAKVSQTSPELSDPVVDKLEERLQAAAAKKAAHSSLQLSLNLAINFILPAFDLMFPKASYLVSAAYRANFFYSYCHNYQSALRVCDETLRRFQATKTSIAATHLSDACSVVLTPKWMRLFDKQIQAVYGIVALSQFLNGKGKYRNSTTEGVTKSPSRAENDYYSSTPAHYVSPVDFIDYIKMQCEAKLLPYRRNSDCGTRRRWFSYCFTCTQRSGFILVAALRISSDNAFLNNYSTPTWNPFTTGYNW